MIFEIVLKVMSVRAAKQSMPRNKFTKGEDRKLRECVRKFGTSNWKAVSSLMPGRNMRQCKDRWEKYLSPDVDNSPFTIDDDIKILKYYSIYGGKWKDLSKLMKGRTDTSIKSRYKLLIRHRETIELLENSKPDMIKEKETQEENRNSEMKVSEIVDSSKLFSSIDEVYSDLSFL